MPVTLNGNGQVPVQVVSTTKTDSFTSAVEDVWTDITGMSVSITPTNASNRVLIMVMASIGAPNNYVRGLRLVRNSTPIAIGNDSTGFEGTTSQGLNVDYAIDTLPIIHLDSPSTTSSTTYKVQFYNESAAVIPFYLNRPYSQSANTWNVVSSITVMEISG